jgi:hypothetical protein
MERSEHIPDDGGAFAGTIRRWAARSCARWERAPETAPDHLPRHTPAQQASRQQDLERMFGRLPVSKARYERLAPGERARLRARVRSWIARSVVPQGDHNVDLFFEQCERVADGFISRAKDFDPALPDRDIHQALRNQWVFNSIQAFCGRPASLTPSSFAYSMLYPLTDNRLDAPDLPAAERATLVRWLSSRLAGVDAGEREDDRRAQIARLLDIIEGEFPRGGFPDVHRSLLAIHNAQKQALVLNAGEDQDREAELLMLTLAKGGTSVLVDGYLVTGTLDENLGENLFGYGVLLQLIDDLQDLDEDCANGHSTPFRRAGNGPALEGLTNKLLNFVRSECRRMSGVSAVPWLLPLIEQSCLSLILEAVARYHRFYGFPWLRMIGECMPVPVDYLGGLRTRMNRRLEEALQ